MSPTLKSLPAFKVQQPIDKEEWNMFTLEKEYEKLGVPNANWKFTVRFYFSHFLIFFCFNFNFGNELFEN